MARVGSVCGDPGGVGGMVVWPGLPGRVGSGSNGAHCEIVQGLILGDSSGAGQWFPSGPVWPGRMAAVQTRGVAGDDDHPPGGVGGEDEMNSVDENWMQIGAVALVLFIAGGGYCFVGAFSST